MSYVDWGTDALFFQANGRYPTFMIKSGAFKVPFIGWVLHKAGQLPVYRGAADAALVLKEAEKRLALGDAVIVYPEGTATRDPQLWPMMAKTGVARLALTTGAPVIPVAHWGTYDILPYGSTKPRFFPRKTVRTIAGQPVDLSRWAGQARSAKALQAATEKIMADVTSLVAGLRGETPPAVPYDWAKEKAKAKASSSLTPRENSSGPAISPSEEAVSSGSGEAVSSGSGEAVPSGSEAVPAGETVPSSEAAAPEATPENP
jgi:1-acyl-sn-glycerol-3-phosphate acyltransferase